MSDDTSAYTATLKAGASFDSPWLVIRADTADELSNLLRDVQHLADPIALSAKTLQGGYTGAPAPTKAQAQAPAPASAPEPSPWDEPTTSNGGFSSGPAFQGQPAPQPQAQGAPNPGSFSTKDDPYYAPKPGTPFDAPPAPQGPPGDKSGIPMVWRTGSGQRGPWRAWMSNQGRDVMAHQKDTAIFYK